MLLNCLPVVASPLQGGRQRAPQEFLQTAGTGESGGLVLGGLGFALLFLGRGLEAMV